MLVAEFAKVSLTQYIEDFRNLCPDLDFSQDIYDDITLPKRATKASAGYDFVLPYDIELKPNESIRIASGIRCKMQEGYVLELYPRSSLGLKYQMALLNTVGIIDADYYGAKNEGHIIVGIINRSDKVLKLNKGDRFVQGIFLAYHLAIEDEVTTERVGGFGSSNQ